MNENFGTQKRGESWKIFGMRAVLEALEAGKELESIYLQKGLSGNLYQEVRKKAALYEVPLHLVPPEKLRSLGDRNHQGVAALLSPIGFHRLEHLVPSIYERGELPLLMILDRITDVRNFGAICRSAECLGVQGMILPRRGAAQINADAVKTSAGALLKLPVCRERNLKNSIQFLQESGIQVVACTEKAEQNITEADFTLPTAIIMGAEEEGISGEYLKLADKAVKIPMEGSTASLNVSVASGIILYEVIRQRTASVAE